jgi:hypothetical protein
MKSFLTLLVCFAGLTAFASGSSSETPHNCAAQAQLGLMQSSNPAPTQQGGSTIKDVKAQGARR